uniref:LisH domain-containing protein n=1 Tax=Macrostomum lignano TaxID=282301 RepID=A0A1I8JJ14_9PLAT
MATAAAAAATDSDADNSIDTHGSISVLQYTVVDCSSYLEQYPPENIAENRPSDQASRWSSETNAPPQYLMLRLTRPALLRRASFGKYEKPHVCNPKRMRISAGLCPTRLYSLATCQLANDSSAESFGLSLQLRGREIPSLFVRLEPLITWGGTFNFSIWFVQLEGVADPDIVDRSLDWLREFRERESIRLCMKHLRKRGHVEAFRALSGETGVKLEHPILTELYDCLVERGEFDRCEELIQTAYDSGLFNQSAGSRPSKAVWQPIEPVANSETGQVQKPGMRGGHQMALDHLAKQIYLFGGWDGYRDLADFWAYDIDANKWRCLSVDTSSDGGPTPRSCHKICFDYERKRLYTLGRYVDSSLRDCPDSMRNDFYVWNADTAQWLLICEDTACQSGGPCLLFDHQMCIHVTRQVIYVFGGRELHRSDTHSGGPAGLEGVDSYYYQLQHGGLSSSSTPSSSHRRLLPAHTYSGLHSYHIATNTWTLLRCDGRMLAPRMGHSMLLHPTADCLYVLAGQRIKEQLTDFVRFDLTTGRAVCLADHACKPSGCGLTQRATLDAELDEIYVLTGPHRDRASADENSLWHSLLRQQQSAAGRAAPLSVGDSADGGSRLDDFWSLRLVRDTPEALARRCRLLLRRQLCLELLRSGRTALALGHLRQRVAKLADPNSQADARLLSRLAEQLVRSTGQQPEHDIDNEGSASDVDSDDESTPSSTSAAELAGVGRGGGSISDQLADAEAATAARRLLRPKRPDRPDTVAEQRRRLFGRLSRLFPEAESQPRAHLPDLLACPCSGEAGGSCGLPL